ncbi:MAG: hypothetical protein ABWX90_03945 [Candidatus Saccharimonadales bacterium]
MSNNEIEMLNVPEWVKTDKFHIPMGRTAVVDLITVVPGISNEAAAGPGDIASGSGQRERVELDSHPNPKNVIGHPSNTIDQDVRRVAGL